MAVYVILFLDFKLDPKAVSNTEIVNKSRLLLDISNLIGYFVCFVFSP